MSAIKQTFIFPRKSAGKDDQAEIEIAAIGQRSDEEAVRLEDFGNLY
jgi:hypothetical protein